MERKPHQIRGVSDVLARYHEGYRRIILQSPTGGGKSLMMEDLMRHFLFQFEKCLLYTNRKMLVDQLSKDLVRSGIDFGVRSAGHENKFDELMQVASLPSEMRRADKWPFHNAKLVMIDEAHMIVNGGFAKKRIKEHLAKGSVVVMVTATPVDMEGSADVMVQAGTVSELRGCGLLVVAHHFGPDEPDLRHVKSHKLGADYTETDNRKAIMTPGVFGRVGQFWFRNNPERHPTILFAPGVEESVWFAEQFYANGVNAASIDGEYIWWNGKAYRNDQELRNKLLKYSKAGQLPVICNRFVMREGVNMPWVRCGIFATVIGSLKSYIQMGGRFLRADPGSGKESAVIFDHGGNWHRHGSLNIDRKWYLDWTSANYAGLRKERLRSGADKEPYHCPKCDRILAGRVCPCGHEIPLGRRSRMVVQHDGELIEHRGEVYQFKPRRYAYGENEKQEWIHVFHQAKKSKNGMNFNSAFGLFARDHFGKYPAPDWPYMPKHDIDLFRRVRDVTRERLT